MEKYQEKLDVEEKRKKAHERLDQWQQSLVEKTLQLKRVSNWGEITKILGRM